MNILGISAFYHDSAAALIVDGRIVAAAQEERFTRVKHDASYPENAVHFCLHASGLSMADIDAVVFFEKPLIKFERLLETYLAFAPRGFSSFRAAIPLWVKEKLFHAEDLRKRLTALAPQTDWKKRLLFSEHHLSHAASAFYPSPFDKAVILTMDGVGEWCTTSVAIGDGRHLSMKKELRFPHSLGLLYSAFTYYLGFKVNAGEYKIMGLAPYGDPRFRELIFEKLIDLKGDGSFQLDLSYFDYCTRLRMTNAKFDQLFGQPVRAPESQLTQFHMDVAASLQAVTEEIVLRLTRALATEYKIANLCLAGGVALNCVANGKILRDGAFQNIWVQPAAGDAGGALGAALAAWHLHFGQDRALCGTDAMRGAFLGPAFSQDSVEQRLTAIGARFSVLSDESLIETTAQALVDGGAVGWFQGAMEFGPRALGGRSILADPRRSDTQKNLNLKIKYRESFRPFAPSVLRERVSDWFELNVDSPYMLMVAPIASQHRKVMTEAEERLFGIDKLNIARSDIPAVTHIDYSARVQTVDEATNPRYHQLLTRFEHKTGCPVLANTSFNVRGEPIVGTPEDAFRCFMGTELNVLVIGNCFLSKSEQDAGLKSSYHTQFELD